MLDPQRALPLFSWANEREAVRIRKAVLEQARDFNTKPQLSKLAQLVWGNGRWTLSHLTDDPILRQYRFCNVYREHDRVTVWIRQNIREPYAEHPNLWFMLAVARYINWPPALQDLLDAADEGAWPSSDDFTPEKMTRVLEARRARGEKTETGAYMIRAESDRNAPWYSWSKQRYVSEVVLGKVWKDRQRFVDNLEPLDPAESWGLFGFWNALQDKHYTGWGPFMAYQVAVDLRWTRYLRDAPDIQRWAAVGPGSRRGLNRLHGRATDFPLKQDDALREMLELREMSQQPGVLAPWMAPIDLSDIQNCLCETDKYLRASGGEGTPRSKYVPGRGY